MKLEDFAGMRVVTSTSMVQVVRRSWRERLFTRPWRPWRATKQVPEDKYYILGNNTVLMAPQMEVLLREALARERESVRWP